MKYLKWRANISIKIFLDNLKWRISHATSPRFELKWFNWCLLKLKKSIENKIEPNDNDDSNDFKLFQFGISFWFDMSSSFKTNYNFCECAMFKWISNCFLSQFCINSISIDVVMTVSIFHGGDKEKLKNCKSQTKVLSILTTWVLKLKGHTVPVLISNEKIQFQINQFRENVLCEVCSVHFIEQNVQRIVSDIEPNVVPNSVKCAACTSMYTTGATLWNCILSVKWKLNYSHNRICFRNFIYKNRFFDCISLIQSGINIITKFSRT